MSIIILSSIIIAGGYGLLICSLIFGLKRILKNTGINHLSFSPKNISIIIPFRNEQTKLPILLESIRHSGADFAGNEFIFVDDHSTDDGPEMVRQFITETNQLSIRLITLADIKHGLYGKKAALNIGINEAQHNVIACTDADCALPMGWLGAMMTHLKEHTQLVCGPVLYSDSKGILNQIFQIEFLSLVLSGMGAAGIGKPIFCSGANLLFRKEAYLTAQKIMAGSQHASGDDVFLLHAILEMYGNNAVAFTYQANCMVTTPAPESIGSFFKQRLRWASKSVSYKNRFALLTSMMVYLMSSTILIMAVDSFFLSQLFWPTIIIFLFKSFVDALFFHTGFALHRKPFLPFVSILLQILYIPYVFFIGLLMFFIKPEWKK